MSDADVGTRGNYGVLFRNGLMDFCAGWLLGYAQQDGLSPGSLLYTFSRIRNGRPRSWTAEFTATAEAERHRARTAEECGRSHEAASAWLATCVAERAALTFQDPVSAAAEATTAAMEDAFGAFLRTAEVPIERWAISFREGTLPAYVSRGFEQASRLFVVIGGGDTYVEDLWFFGGGSALRAGWPVLLVDLPGQGSTPRQGFHFGSQTMDGLRAVVDAVHQRGFTGELVLVGWSGGGIFVTNFVSTARPEDRVRAWVASTPVYDPTALFRNAMPALLQQPAKSVLVRGVLGLARRNPVLRVTLAKYDWQFGPDGILGSLTATDGVRSDLEALDAPLLALVGLSEDPESLRQARDVVAAVRRRHPQSELVTFEARSGASAHCQVGNLGLAMDRIFAWLTGLGVTPEESERR